MRMLEIYRRFQEEDLAIPVIPGLKTESEKFPGAIATYCIEAMMQDGKALQAGTSHNLGQNFAKAFDITFLDRKNEQSHAWTTSWGVTTRMIGALIMTHGDDDGLIIPPRIAPVQVVIIPIFTNDSERAETKAFAESIAERLHSRLDRLKVVIDHRDDLRPAEKFFHWLQQGIPVRIEVGPRDVAKQCGMVARRDVREKESVELESITTHVCDLLEKIQENLFQRALEFREQNTRRAKNYEEFCEIMKKEGGFVMAHWNGSPEVEAKIKRDTKATIRCIPLDPDPVPGKCMVTGEPSEREVVFAVAY